MTAADPFPDSRPLGDLAGAGIETVDLTGTPGYSYMGLADVWLLAVMPDGMFSAGTGPTTEDAKADARKRWRKWKRANAGPLAVNGTDSAQAQGQEAQAMTWDGIPEHRNLSGDGEEPPKTADDYRREIADWLSSRPKPAPSTAAEFMREQARRMGRHDPEPDPMPADPFNGITEAAVAQVAMIEAVRESGLSEPSALFYVACLVQVGLAIQQGGLGQPPQEPGQM